MPPKAAVLSLMRHESVSLRLKGARTHFAHLFSDDQGSKVLPSCCCIAELTGRTLVLVQNVGGQCHCYRLSTAQSSS
jgi:hypothetical protein